MEAEDRMMEKWGEQMLINAWAPAASGVLAYCFLPRVATPPEQRFPSKHHHSDSNNMWPSRRCFWDVPQIHCNLRMDVWRLSKTVKSTLSSPADEGNFFLHHEQQSGQQVTEIDPKQHHAQISKKQQYRWHSLLIYN